MSQPSATARLAYATLGAALVALLLAATPNSAVMTWNGDAGHWSPEQSRVYGEIYDYESATALTLTNQNTYYTVTDTNLGSCLGMTCSTLNDDITAAVAGTYLVNATAGMTLDTNNQVIELKVYNEGTGLDNCAISRKIATGADQGAASITCLVVMAVGDSLTLRIANMTGAGAAVSLQHMNLNAHVIQ